MQKTTVNPNPEQEMTVNPFAQEQAAEIQPQENTQTYPVEVDGDIVELTLEELIEGRHYYDAYVLGAKCGGVYALVDEDCRSSAPTISQGKITAFGKVRYTLDGSDPRYSDSAKDYVAGTVLTPETGCKIRA